MSLLRDPPDAADPARRGGTKSANAFRTISEVADELDVPQHVLRFWETKFLQIRPLKRGGGRRYYRPEDVDLLRRISQLLYREGYTIKGVQRLLREGQLRPERREVAEIPLPLDLEEPEIIEYDFSTQELSAPKRRSTAVEAEEMRQALSELVLELREISTLLRRD